uniref:Uncharacterized protein n=1 Tax=viral metagenome TaxID=1070528 RepID=A0A6H1ZLP9_9ZZZZ
MKEIKKLLNEIKELLEEIKKGDEFERSFNQVAFEDLKVVRSEKFIDEVVDRINRKQLK